MRNSYSQRIADRFRRITSSSHHYIPEIDGLRFIAIFSVILFHVYFAATNVQGRMLTSSPADVLVQLVQYGNRGVELFFVISGFILGMPFATYYLASGREVSLGKYYLRRVTRLEPPYILTLLAFYAAAVVLRTPDTVQPGFWSGMLLRLGYLHYLVRGLPSLNGVTWTLEIEVQFYLLAPLLAKIFALSPKWRRGLLAVLIGALPAVTPHIPIFQRTVLGYAQYFLIGFLLADVHVSGFGVKRFSRGLTDVLGLIALLAVFYTPTCLAFAIAAPWLLAVMVLAALRGAGFRWMLIRQPLIPLLGGMCYSLYLLHYPILSFIAQKVVRDGMSVLSAWMHLAAIGVPAAVVAGIILYIFLERPCMNPNWPKMLLLRLNLFRRVEPISTPPA